MSQGPKIGPSVSKGGTKLDPNILIHLEHSSVCSLQKTWLELVPPYDTEKWSGSRTNAEALKCNYPSFVNEDVITAALMLTLSQLINLPRC